MHAISGDTREEVWLKAINHLLFHAENHIEYNLIMEINKPASHTDRSKIIRSEIDQLLRSSSLYSVNTVAETIFPAAEYKKSGLVGVMENYPQEIYPWIKRIPGNSKGTYANRIVRGINAKGNSCNPLKEVMNRLKSQISNQGIRCAFELALDEVDTIPINRNDCFTRGFPCLSHLSFKLNQDRSAIYLTALYRSQDYIQKAVGNLLGLARLQACVARELKINVGPLVCHSTIARLDTPKGIGKRKVEKLIRDNRLDKDESE